MIVKIGNIFESHAQTLVNTVNCVGVMGKGIARDFKNKYPEMFKEYAQLCAQIESNPACHIITPIYLEPQSLISQRKTTGGLLLNYHILKMASNGLETTTSNLVLLPLLSPHLGAAMVDCLGI